MDDIVKKNTNRHLLRQLKFPARYEALVKAVGNDVARLVVMPGQGARDTFEGLAEGVKSNVEGRFVPLVASTGTGKTTLAQSLSNFFPNYFSPTISFEGDVTYELLVAVAKTAKQERRRDDERIIPINIDGRESNAPTVAELATLKRFAREPSVGYQCVVLWPETSDELANSMAADYANIAGDPPVPLPAIVVGPPEETWQQIAIHTLALTNDANDLELLGVDPRDYDSGSFPSIGEYLRAISQGFAARRLELLRATQKPLRLCIVIASETPDAGVLTHLTNANRFGLLDGAALISATKSA